MMKIIFHLYNVKYLLGILMIFGLLSTVAAHADASESQFNAKEGFLITISRFESAILKLNNRLTHKQATRLATLIAIESKKNGLDPRIVLAILNTESSFNQKAVSSTGDLSIAQMNPKVWTPKMFQSRTGQTIEWSRVKKDEAYAISRMVLILSWLKNSFSKHDKWWFARYHSATPEFKNIYIVKLTKNFKILKPFGRNLLRDMPTVKSIAQIPNLETKDLKLAELGINKYEAN